MDTKFSEMMEWAFGPSWKHENVKHSPETWKRLHPGLEELKTITDTNMGINSAYYIFQIASIWMLETQNCPKQCKKKEIYDDEPSFHAMFAVMWSDFMQLFKPKTRTSRR